MRNARLCGALALLVLGIAPLQADGPSPVLIAYTGAGCHGTDGSSAGPSSPHIAGMGKAYFIDSMQQFKTDERDSTIMNRIAKAYSDEQIAGMADFFARQELRLPPQQHDPAKAVAVAKLHEDHCESCHEGGGREPGDSGTLAGQWMPYLTFSMDDFQSGTRKMPKKMRRAVEKAIADGGEGAIEALNHYYVSHQ